MPSFLLRDAANVIVSQSIEQLSFGFYRAETFADSMDRGRVK